MQMRMTLTVLYITDEIERDGEALLAQYAQAWCDEISLRSADVGQIGQWA